MKIVYQSCVAGAREVLTAQAIDSRVPRYPTNQQVDAAIDDVFGSNDVYDRIHDDACGHITNPDSLDCLLEDLGIEVPPEVFAKVWLEATGEALPALPPQLQVVEEIPGQFKN